MSNALTRPLVLLLLIAAAGACRSRRAREPAPDPGPAAAPPVAAAAPARPLRMLTIDGCPDKAIAPSAKVTLSPHLEGAPPAGGLAWTVEGEPAGKANKLTWTPPPKGGERGYEINLVIPGHERASCVVQVHP
jgi:hypothetical protein